MHRVLWQLDRVSLTSQGHTRLRSLSLSIHSGVTALLGESGAGKTSLLNLLVGLDEPTSGTIQFTPGDPQNERHVNVNADHDHDAEINDERPPLFWVPQDHGLWPHLSVAEHLAMVSIDAPNSSKDQPSSDELLAMFDLTKRRDAKPAQLSLGERARISVARALATQARIIVMDEPLAHVDAARAPGFWQAIAEQVQRIGASWIFATHEPQTVLAHAHRVITLNAGSLRSYGDVHTLYHRPPSETAGRCLGEINWLNAHEAQLWLGLSQSQPATEEFVSRPEQLSVLLDPTGPLAVESFVFRGPTSHVRLKIIASGEVRQFAMRSPSDPLKCGDRVRLAKERVSMVYRTSTTGGKNA